MKNKKEYLQLNFLEALFLVFLALKLAGKIDWSWWWVFAPLWVPVAAGVFVIGLAFLGVVIFNPKWKKKDKK